MTREDTVKLLQSLKPDQEQDWLIDFGMQLTISARAEYPVEEQPGNLQRLLGFNEIQHQVYGRIHHVRRGNAWTLESFLDGLWGMAQQYGIEGGFSFALKSSLSRVR